LKQELYLRFGVNLIAHFFLAVIATIIINIILYSFIHAQETRNAYLSKEMGYENSRLITLNKNSKELDAITTKVNFLYGLKESSYQAVRQLDELANIVPQNITLRKVSRKGSEITLSGDSASNLQITLLMRNISVSNIFKNPDLTEINVKENDSSNKQFVLKMQTKSTVSQ